MRIFDLFKTIKQSGSQLRDFNGRTGGWLIWQRILTVINADSNEDFLRVINKTNES